ncbi:MAG: hypothetical protein ACKO37_10270 [Vampirovibrionales bacterium]
MSSSLWLSSSRVPFKPLSFSMKPTHTERFGASVDVPHHIVPQVEQSLGKASRVLPLSVGERALNTVSKFMQWVRSSTVNELVVIDELSMGLPRALIELFLRPFNRIVLARETFFRENAGLITMGPLSGWLTGGSSLGLNRPSIVNPKGLNLKAHINLEVAHHFFSQAQKDIHQAPSHQSLEHFRDQHLQGLLSQLKPTDLDHWKAYVDAQGLQHTPRIGKVPQAVLEAFKLPHPEFLSQAPLTPEAHHAMSRERLLQSKPWLKETLSHVAQWGMTEKVTLQDPLSGSVFIPRRPLSSTLTDLKHYTHEVLDNALAHVKQAGHTTMTPEAKHALNQVLFERNTQSFLPHVDDSFLHYLNKQKRLTATAPIMLAVALAIIPNYVNIWLTKRQTGSTLFPAEAPTMNANIHAVAKTEADAKILPLPKGGTTSSADSELVTLGELKKQLSQAQTQTMKPVVPSPEPLWVPSSQVSSSTLQPTTLPPQTNGMKQQRAANRSTTLSTTLEASPLVVGGTPC